MPSSFASLTLKLVPAEGPAPTIGGELIRATLQINHNAFDHRFAKNTTGALNYIRSFCPVTTPEVKAAMRLIGNQIRRTGTGSWTTEIRNALDIMTTHIVDYVATHPDIQTSPNNVDMNDMQEDIFYDSVG